MKRLFKRAALTAGMVALLACPNVVLAQGGGAGGAGGGTGATDAGAGAPASLAAPVPQYWVADASIFIANAMNTAAVMDQERRLNVQAPSIIGSQASFLVDAANRALGDLNSLEQNALDTNPPAVPAIRDAIAQLVAAKAEASRVVAAAKRGQLGPTYGVTVTSTLGHLHTAEQAMAHVGRVYGATRFATAVGFGRRGGSGIGGGFAGRGTGMGGAGGGGRGVGMGGAGAGMGGAGGGFAGRGAGMGGSNGGAGAGGSGGFGGARGGAGGGYGGAGNVAGGYGAGGAR